MSPKFELISLPGAEQVAQTVARDWAAAIAAARSAGSIYTVALSGGRIAGLLFTHLAGELRLADAAYDHVHFFWADERCVLPTDSQSNFRSANEVLFQPLGIPAAQVHRLRGEDQPEAAAVAASQEFLTLAPIGPTGQAVLDLVLLGMGEDGHVASLFPGAPAELVDGQTPFMVVRDSPKPPPIRLTLSYGVILAARQVWVLATGAGKAAALRESISLQGQTPLGRVIQLRGQTKIFTDLAAF